MEWTVAQLAARAGISGRTLRHYDQVGLLRPDRVGTNGYRYYGPTAVARLQHILLLRETGMGLAEIVDVLERTASDPAEEQRALEQHLERLRSELETTRRRMAAVQATLDARRAGRDPDPDVLLDGFNDRYEAEVVERWGRDAYASANDWWHGKSLAQQRAWKADADRLWADWRALHDVGADPGNVEAQAMAERHVAWLATIPGTPTHAGNADRSRQMIAGLARQYATDPNFVHALGGAECAAFVRDALLGWIEVRTSG